MPDGAASFHLAVNDPRGGEAFEGVLTVRNGKQPPLKLVFDAHGDPLGHFLSALLAMAGQPKGQAEGVFSAGEASISWELTYTAPLFSLAFNPGEGHPLYMKQGQIYPLLFELRDLVPQVMEQLSAWEAKLHRRHGGHWFLFAKGNKAYRQLLEALGRRASSVTFTLEEADLASVPFPPVSYLLPVWDRLLGLLSGGFVSGQTVFDLGAPQVLLPQREGLQITRLHPERPAVALAKRLIPWREVSDIHQSDTGLWVLLKGGTGLMVPNAAFEFPQEQVFFGEQLWRAWKQEELFWK
jgi:hypothetical protein